jgi:hemerythrin-like metal-binding protein
MIDLELANVRHGIFVLRLELLVNGVEDVVYDPEIIADDAVCDLGRWLIASRWLLAERPEYGQLQEAHRVFHRHAGEIVRRFNAGDHAAAKGLLDGDLAKASLSIYVAIDRLKAALHVEREERSARNIPSHRWLVALAQGDAPDLMVGIPVIDAQHSRIAAVIARLLDQPERCLREASVWSDVIELGRLIRHHFDTEEKLMRRAVAPAAELALHEDEHAQLLMSYERMLQQGGEGTTIDAIPAAFLVEQWMVDHIRGHDLKLAAYAQLAATLNLDEPAPPPNC